MPRSPAIRHRRKVTSRRVPADLEDIRDRVLRNLFGTSENGIKEPSSPGR